MLKRLLGAAMLVFCAPAVAQHPPEVIMPPPPDNVAGMRATYAQARDAGTSAALILFIARHPEHPLADAARSDLAHRSVADPAPPPGPDGNIIFRFDAARRDGSATALNAFASRHPGHPLATEAARPEWRE